MTHAENKEAKAEARWMGAEAYKRGDPCEAPGYPVYNREAHKASWRIGWKREAARIGQLPPQSV